MIYKYETIYLNLRCSKDGIESISFCEAAEPEKAVSEMEEMLVSQLDEYFAGKRKSFDLPLRLKGTEFQTKVWKALELIPYGETCSYGDLAAGIGRPKAQRAVGSALHDNPLPIVIPCHRVLAAGKKLGGFGGGLEIKKYLLKLEERNK